MAKEKKSSKPRSAEFEETCKKRAKQKKQKKRRRLKSHR